MLFEMDRYNLKPNSAQHSMGSIQLDLTWTQFHSTQYEPNPTQFDLDPIPLNTT